MGPINQTDRITARQREIAKELARLQEESNELTIALKVIKRLGADSLQDGPAIIKTAGASNKSGKITKLGPPRPNGCPTNFQMVDMILASAEKEGKDGLSVSEIINEIRTRYWPGLKEVQVSAPIYGFAAKGRFKKTASGKLKRIKKNKEGHDSIEPNPGAPPSDEDNGHNPMNG